MTAGMGQMTVLLIMVVCEPRAKSSAPFRVSCNKPDSLPVVTGTQ
jgi:hypothetical protein